MKHAKKMFLMPEREKDSKISIIEEFEKEIFKIFNNKSISSSERIAEYIKVITKYEYNHFSISQNKANNENVEEISIQNEARNQDVSFKLQDAIRNIEDNHASSSTICTKRNEYDSLASKAYIVADKKPLSVDNGEKMDLVYNNPDPNSTPFSENKIIRQINSLPIELNYDNMNTPQTKRNLLQPKESKIKDIYSKIKRKRINHNCVRNKKITHLEKDDRYTLVEISSEIQIRSHENIVTEISLGSYVIHDIYEFFQIRI
jgi:hypothetical protein